MFSSSYRTGLGGRVTDDDVRAKWKNGFAPFEMQWFWGSVDISLVFCFAFPPTKRCGLDAPYVHAYRNTLALVSEQVA